MPHRRWAIPAGLLVTAVALALIAPRVVMPGPSAPPAASPAASPTAPTFTYVATWTLLDLANQVDAGQVLAITAAPGAPTARGAVTTGPVLAARTKDGQSVGVATGLSLDASVAALRGLGYGRLLTQEALATPPADGVPPLLVILPLVGLMVLLTALTRSARARDRARLTRNKPRPVAIPQVRLADVAGVDEAKLELAETIEFLRDPGRFARMGAKPVRGVMLYGPPGTGKTLLAKAVAAEAGVPFFAASGSEFVEKFVGVGAGRIRELFAKARSAGAGVIFIDEIDAVGKARGGPNSHDEREQTLNQLLIELDGFSTTDTIAVIAATNRLDTLDPALLRPGRFTRKVNVPLPDKSGRAEILTVHALNKPLDAAVDLAALARKTAGFSGAQLADLLNEAAIFAVRAGRAVIEPGDVHAGWLKTALGTSRRRSMDERERSIIAAHEAGHAICGTLHGDKRRVEEISLFAHGDALGVTVSSQEDDDLPAESGLRARLVALMGGRAAEELLFREVTGGASNDFEQANRIATSMVTRWGMGVDPEAADGGVTGRGILSTFVTVDQGYVPSEVKDAQGRAIRAILDEAYAEARATLRRELPRLRRVAAYLFEQERIDGEEFDALMAGTLRPLNEGEWRSAASSPREWQEVAAFERPVARVAALAGAASRVPGRGPLRGPGGVPGRGIPASTSRRRLGRTLGRRLATAIRRATANGTAEAP